MQKTLFFAFTPLVLGAINAQGQEYSLTIEATPAVTEGLTTSAFYVDMNDATDRMSAVFGNNEYALEFNAPEGAFNSAFNASWNASGINPRIFGHISGFGGRHLRPLSDWTVRLRPQA